MAGTPTDWGDKDLELALQSCHRPVPLVVFGHMHEQLQDGGRRQMVREAGGRLYVNCARVPRWRRGETATIERAVTLIELSSGSSTAARSTGGSDSADRSLAFAPAEGMVTSVESVWLTPSGSIVERRRLWGAEMPLTRVEPTEVE